MHKLDFPKRIIALDPGFTGAIACLDLNMKGETTYTNVEYFPTEIKKSGKANRTHYKVKELVDLIRFYTNTVSVNNKLIVIESVSSMPHDGRVQAFALGYGFGLLLGITSASIHNEIILVRPNIWKKEFVEKGADKDTSRLKAIELFPQMADKLKLKKSHGMAEALLIAEWERRKLLNVK